MSRLTALPTITDDSSLGGTVIERSVKFNADDSSEFTKTFSSSGDRKRWTWSAWIKLKGFATKQTVFSAGSGSNFTSISFTADGEFNYKRKIGGSNDALLTTNSLFRDTNSWYHFVVYEDAQNTVSKFYVNGSEITDLDTSNGGQPSDVSGFMGSNVEHLIGQAANLNTEDFGGYVADMHFIDGQALDPSHFGYTETQTGIWRPKKFIPEKINSGKTWSFGGTVSYDNIVSGSITDVFDGSTDTALTVNKTGSGWFASNHFQLSSINVVASKVGVIVSNCSTDLTVRVNGSIVGTIAGGDIVNDNPKHFEFTFTETLVTTINVLRAGSDSGWQIYALSLNGVKLINGNKSNIGVNGFHLDFSDNTSVTTLGIDKSNNGNDFTTANLSVGSGISDCSMLDTPTNNFPTINHLLKGPRDAGTDGVSYFNQGNLGVNFAGSGDDAAASMSVSSGRWYHEVKLTNSQNQGAGWTLLDNFSRCDSTIGGTTGGIVNTDAFYGVSEESTGSLIVNNGSTSASSEQFADNDIIGFAFNVDNGTLAIYRNGTLISTLTGITAGTSSSGISSSFVPIVGDDSSTDATFEMNFGQHSFSYTPPAGYKKLCSRNLSPNSDDQLILRPKKHFGAIAYTGEGGTQSVTGLEFQPDLVWIRRRNSTNSHQVYDSVRGPTKNIRYDLTNAEADTTNFVRFDPGGFTLANGSNAHNADGSSYVAWCWKGGDAAVTNNDGNRTSTISVNKKAGFSIVTWTGNGSDGQTIGHGLDRAPEVYFLKSRTTTGDNYFFYHTFFNGSHDFLKLSGLAASGDSSYDPPSNTVLYRGTGDANNENMLAHCWHSVPGYSKFGIYEGSGSSNGPYVELGFKPAFLLTKAHTGTNANTYNWSLYDSARDVDNPVIKAFYLSNAAELSVSAGLVDFTSSGFKIRTTSNMRNAKGVIYVYMAFAEQPSITPFGTYPNAR